jgi:hypothetical protein
MPSSPARTVSALLAAAGLVSAVAGCSSASLESYCVQVARLAADNPAAVFAAWDPSDPAASQADLERAARRLRTLAEAAPPEVEDDAGLVADVAEDLATVLTDMSGDELEAALGERAEDFDRVDEASRRLTQFTRSECGIDLEAPPTTPVPTPAPTTTTAATAPT